MAFWSRKPKQPTMDVPVLLDEPPLFQGWQSVRLLLAALAFAVIIGIGGTGYLFFGGIEENRTQVKTVVPLDKSILRE